MDSFADGSESRSDLRHESGMAGLVEGLRGVLFEVVAEAIVVIVHPREQAGRSLVRIRPRCLTGPDPGAVKITDELAEGAARIVEFLSLGVSRGEERLVRVTARDGSLAIPGLHVQIRVE